MNAFVKLITIAALGLCYFAANAATQDQGQKQINECIGAVTGDCVAGNIAIGNKSDLRKEINWCVGSVTGDCVGGDVSIGSASDKISISEDGILIQNLGVIKKEQTTELSLLLSGKKIIAFTPTIGDYANRQFKLLAVAIDLNNIPTSGITTTLFPHAQDIKNKNSQVQTLFGLYRQSPGQQGWSPLLLSVQLNPFASIKPTFIISPNGQVTYLPAKYTNADGIIVQPKPIVYAVSSAS